MSQQRDELVCGVVSLVIKCCVALVAVISCAKLAASFQHRQLLYRELQAENQLQQDRLATTRAFFDKMFQVGDWERIDEHADQWIAPNRRRVIWKQPSLD